MLLNALTILLASVLSGFLYYLGGCSKEEGHKKLPFLPLWLFNTLTRDIGCSVIASLTLWKLYGLHWSLVLACGLLYGALTTYHKWLNKFFKKPKDDCYWFNWLMTGLCYGLSSLPYVYFYQHNYFGLVLMAITLAYLTMVWSEKQDKVEIEASGRGALIILTLPLLSSVIVKSLVVALVLIAVVVGSKKIIKIENKK